ncbi:MAG: sugar porter family MFS transporter [Rhizobiales bacterium]|nr:sugar porter family MFS transporter [Hyphomicrobiales bacterium]
MAYVIACIAALAGLLTGYDESVITATLAPLGKTLLAEPMEAGLMTVTLPLGAFAGAFTGALLAPAWGRRSLLMAAAALFTLGALLCAVAPGIILHALGRFVLGVAIGIGAIMAPAYIAETAPAARRGMLACAYPIAFSLGVLAAYLVGVRVADDWRILFATAAVPGLVLLVGLWRLPETPAALVQAGREGEAGLLLARLNGWKSRDPKVAARVAALRTAARADMRNGNWRELLAPDIRPALVAGAGLFFFQQVTGIGAAIHFAPTVFAQAGFDDGGARVATTLGFGALNIAVMILAMVLMDRVGRRLLLFVGFGGAALSLAMLAGVAAIGTPDVQVFAFMGLALYGASFSLAIGPLPWVLAAEVFPLTLRGAGLAFATLSNWVFGLLALLALPALEAAMGFAGVFALSALMSVLALLFGARCIPETKGLALEEIEAHLRSGRPLRTLGAPARR